MGVLHFTCGECGESINDCSDACLTVEYHTINGKYLYEHTVCEDCFQDLDVTKDDYSETNIFVLYPDQFPIYVDGGFYDENGDFHNGKKQTNKNSQ